MKSVLENNPLKIYSEGKTVFGIDELAMVLGASNRDNLKSSLNYYVNRGYLGNPRKGIYTIADRYSKYELGNKIYKPSYISLDTVLANEGVIFQYSSDIPLVSYLSRDIDVDGQKFCYKKIKDEVLFDMTGIYVKDNYYIASLERAFLDKIYLNPDFYFDNLGKINFDKAYEIAAIYGKEFIFKTLDSYKNAR